MTDEKLLPCPFCGGEAMRQACEVFVFCSKCGVTIDSGANQPKSDAHWNRRTPPPRSRCNGCGDEIDPLFCHECGKHGCATQEDGT